MPASRLSFTVLPEPLKTPQFLQLALSCVSALVTSLAVIVALFKEDIRKFWEFSNIKVSMPEEAFFEELNFNTGSSSDSSDRSLEALLYNCNIDVVNAGNLSALDLEIYLESLTFKGDDYPTLQNIKVDSGSVHWNEFLDEKINLSPEGKKTVTILQLTGPSQQSSPEGNKMDISSKLTIADIDIEPRFKKGRWVCVFAISSTNSKPVRFQLEIDWNGGWEKRAKEMSRNLQIKLVQK